MISPNLVKIDVKQNCRLLAFCVLRYFMLSPNLLNIDVHQIEVQIEAGVGRTAVARCCNVWPHPSSFCGSKVSHLDKVGRPDKLQWGKWAPSPRIIGSGMRF